VNIPPRILAKLAVKTPDVLAAVVRETARSRYGALLDYYCGRGRSLKPRYLDLKLTHRCNLRCRMCGQWGERGTYRDAAPEVLRQELDLPCLRRLVDEAAAWGAMVYLWGGEPFLYRDIIPLIEHIKRRRLICAINTNGTHLERDAAALVEAGVDNLLISVDGPEAVHDAVRGRPGVFRQVVKGIQAVAEMKVRRRRAKPLLTLTATVSETNVDHLEAVYALGEKVGADFVGLVFSTFTDERRGLAYQRLVNRHFGTPGLSWRGFVSDKTAIDCARLAQTVDRVQSARHSFATYFIPDLRPSDVCAYYRDMDETFGRRRCLVPWVRADVLPNGDVYPCIDFPDVIVGNVREESLSAIWNGPRYRAFRRLVRRGLLPICHRCSGLYEF
jgi:radical SAM protein with 4Fe4S-binding SPASM domain